MKSIRKILAAYRTNISYTIGEAEEDLSNLLTGVKWVHVSDKLPPIEDKDYLVVVRNKNKEDGIPIQDIANFTGGTWIKNNTWEDVVYWTELPVPPF